jgi:hypothetical protein
MRACLAPVRPRTARRGLNGPGAAVEPGGQVLCGRGADASFPTGAGDESDAAL